MATNTTDEKTGQGIDFEADFGDGRQATILSMHSRGMTQKEIAKSLGVDQSTVSRELKQVRMKAQDLVKYRLSGGAAFELSKMLSELDEVAKTLWNIIGDKENYTGRDRIGAIGLLMKCSEKRMDEIVGGPGLFKATSDISYDESDDRTHELIHGDRMQRKIPRWLAARDPDYDFSKERNEGGDAVMTAKKGETDA